MTLGRGTPGTAQTSAAAMNRLGVLLAPGSPFHLQVYPRGK
jgi:hypothetical protein